MSNEYQYKLRVDASPDGKPFCLFNSFKRCPPACDGCSGDSLRAAWRESIRELEEEDFKKNKIDKEIK